MDFQRLKIRQADILQLVEESLKALSLPEGVRVHLRCDLEDRTVWLDREAIARVFAELEKNGCEAMPEGGDLTIVIGEEGDRIAVAVEDRGCGIAPKEMDQLFTPFFSTKPVGEGVGLGLAFVYGTVKAHGGSVVVESNADPQGGATGTTVRVTLPRRTFLKDLETNVILHDD